MCSLYEKSNNISKIINIKVKGIANYYLMIYEKQ